MILSPVIPTDSRCRYPCLLILTFGHCLVSTFGPAACVRHGRNLQWSLVLARDLVTASNGIVKTLF